MEEVNKSKHEGAGESQPDQGELGESRKKGAGRVKRGADEKEGGGKVCMESPEEDRGRKVKRS